MTNAFHKIMAGLDDARVYLNGERAGFATHQVEMSGPDLVVICSNPGLSQPGLRSEHRHATENAQELGTGPTPTGRANARAVRTNS